MNKKQINFGSGTATFLDFNTKTKILDILYSKINLSNFRYVLLNNIQRLKFLQENEHLVSPNFKGLNYLIVFCKINDISYCVAIDRKRLSYHKDQLDIKSVNIFLLKMKTSNSIYDLTIFDGKLIHNLTNKSIFLIQDCWYLEGNPVMELNMMKKMNQLNEIIKDHFQSYDYYSDNFDFKLNKFYKYNELDNLVREIIPTIKLPVSGLNFIPFKSGVSILFLERKENDKPSINISTNNKEVIEQHSYHIIHDFINFLKSRTYSYELGKQRKLQLSRVGITDVYYVTDTKTNENLGIAHIPNLKISQMCNENITTKPVLFNCVYCNKTKKWIPISIVN